MATAPSFNAPGAALLYCSWDAIIPLLPPSTTTPSTPEQSDSLSRYLAIFSAEAYADTLWAAHFDSPLVVSTLSSSDLVALGVTKLGARKKLLAAVGAVAAALPLAAQASATTITASPPISFDEFLDRASLKAAAAVLKDAEVDSAAVLAALTPADIATLPIDAALTGLQRKLLLAADILSSDPRPAPVVDPSPPVVAGIPSLADSAAAMISAIPAGSPMPSFLESFASYARPGQPRNAPTPPSSPYTTFVLGNGADGVAGGGGGGGGGRGANAATDAAEALAAQAAALHAELLRALNAAAAANTPPTAATATAGGVGAASRANGGAAAAGSRPTPASSALPAIPSGATPVVSGGSPQYDGGRAAGASDSGGDGSGGGGAGGSGYGDAPGDASYGDAGGDPDAKQPPPPAAAQQDDGGGGGGGEAQVYKVGYFEDPIVTYQTGGDEDAGDRGYGGGGGGGGDGGGGADEAVDPEGDEPPADILFALSDRGPSISPSASSRAGTTAGGSGSSSAAFSLPLAASRYPLHSARRRARIPETALTSSAHHPLTGLPVIPRPDEGRTPPPAVVEKDGAPRVLLPVTLGADPLAHLGDNEPANGNGFRSNGSTIGPSAGGGRVAARRDSTTTRLQLSAAMGRADGLAPRVAFDFTADADGDAAGAGNGSSTTPGAGALAASGGNGLELLQPAVAGGPHGLLPRTRVALEEPWEWPMFREAIDGDRAALSAAALDEAVRELTEAEADIRSLKQSQQSAAAAAVGDVNGAAANRDSGNATSSSGGAAVAAGDLDLAEKQRVALLRYHLALRRVEDFARRQNIALECSLGDAAWLVGAEMHPSSRQVMDAVRAIGDGTGTSQALAAYAARRASESAAAIKDTLPPPTPAHGVSATNSAGSGDSAGYGESDGPADDAAAAAPADATPDSKSPSARTAARGSRSRTTDRPSTAPSGGSGSRGRDAADAANPSDGGARGSLSTLTTPFLSRLTKLAESGRIPTLNAPGTARPAHVGGPLTDEDKRRLRHLTLGQPAELRRLDESARAYTERMERFAPQVARMYAVQDAITEDGWIPDDMKRRSMLIRSAGALVANIQSAEEADESAYVRASYQNDSVAQSILALPAGGTTAPPVRATN